MKRSEIAKEKFQCYNCCQSVLTTFADEYELNEKTALRLAAAFGSGMGRGVTCGAVTGAYMVLGLKNTSFSSLSEGKANIKAMVKNFNSKFIEKHGSLLCKELIEYDLSIPEEAEKASNEGVFDNVCPAFISTAVEILESEF